MVGTLVGSTGYVCSSDVRDDMNDPLGLDSTEIGSTSCTGGSRD